MSGFTEDSRRCEAIRDELAELALGTLAGRSRAEVLDHVGSCSRCSAELEQTTVVADALLQLAPEVEPTVGFELRLARKLREEAVRRQEAIRWPIRARRLSILGAVAAVVVLLAFALGALVAGNGNSGPANQGRSATANLTTADLTWHGQVVGEVMISSGNPAWMFMTISQDQWPGKVTCQVALAGGKVETVGMFTLTGGYGAWGAPLTAPAGEVRSARLVDQSGAVLASAQLPR